MNRILVTGAAGQVGSAIRSIQNGYKYTFFFTDRKELDITDKNAVLKFVKNNKVDIIINCAAYTAVDLAESEKDKCFLINEKAVGYLAEACAQNEGLLVHISSDYVYHCDHNQPMSENSTTKPKGVYATSKLAGEHLALANCPNTIILRTSWVYSYEGKNFVKTIDRLAKNRDHLTVVNDQIGSPTYALDIAKTILELLMISNEKEISGTYNFCNEGFISWYDFAKEIVRYRAYECKVDPVPSSAYPTAAKRPLNSRLDTSKIQGLGIHLSPWLTSLHNCLDKLN